MIGPRVLLVAFDCKPESDAKTTARGIVWLIQSLEKVGIHCHTCGHGQGDGRPTVGISINYQPDAVKVSEVLRNLTTVDWEVVGPPCPDHSRLTVSTWTRPHGETWKCFAPRCHIERPVEGGVYLTMTGFMRWRNSGTLTGRMSTSGPPDIHRKEKPVPGAEEILNNFDYAHFEQALLYTYSQLVETPRNYRQIGDVTKAAQALQCGVPVAFEATPDGTDKLDEAVCRARSRDMQDGEFVVQYRPMSHVMPDRVLSMAQALKGKAKEASLGRDVPGRQDFEEAMGSLKNHPFEPIIVDDVLVSSSGFKPGELAFPLQGRVVSNGEDPHLRSQIEMAKAQMGGQVPKGATVMDIVAMQANKPNKNGDVFSIKSLRQMGKSISFSPERIAQKLELSPKQAADIIESYFQAWPALRKYADKTRTFARFYGGEDPLVRELKEELKALTEGATRREQDVADLSKAKSDLEIENRDLKGKLRTTSDKLNITSRKLKTVSDLRAMADNLVRTIAGMNLQDQPLSVQREVKEALLAVMKVLKGEDLT